MSSPQGYQNPPRLNKGMQATLGEEVVREPSLMFALDQTRRRLDGLGEALDMLRSKLDPVLLQEVDKREERGNTPVNPGSMAMQNLDGIHAQIDRLHAAVNDLLRRAAV
jgi:hypothetical protein